MKKVRIVLVILAGVLILLQFIPTTLPGNSAVINGDLILNGNADEVADILKNACYDCHSNQVDFPWYAKVAPASWLVARDIREGKEQLNFSEWEDYSKRNKIGKLESIQEEVTSGAMPLKVYTLMHKEARLSAEQTEAIRAWTEEFTNRIMQ
jgi:hypothetical protein